MNAIVHCEYCGETLAADDAVIYSMEAESDEKLAAAAERYIRTGLSPNEFALSFLHPDCHERAAQPTLW
jgi:hypothetical protein